ncbi:hypothetical protein CgunFtcFv8_020111 [Champsocephalus gunnari]|uniref:Uncharacterized protein n=1 Tax=Champsocephalus gunnari TaxID=52237 RepID=A0AAN8HPA3_CHAGU|nr:hypothetical protein CgunFtcFv8_020111 [Champsocephalus gunnari]
MASQAARLKQKEQPGPYLRPVITAFTNTGSTGVFIYKGVEISTSSTSAEAFHRQRSEIVNIINACIGQRFSTFSTDPVLLTSEIFDPVNMLAEDNINAIQQYGDSELRKLCEHFEPLLTSYGCNVAEVEREWLKAKYDIVHYHKREAFLVLWQRMLT